jgi:hypothetical protein
MNPVDYTHQSGGLYPPVCWMVSASPVDGIRQSGRPYPPIRWVAPANPQVPIPRSGRLYPPVRWTVSTSPADYIRRSGGLYPPIRQTISANLVDYTRQSAGAYPRITGWWETGVVGEGSESYLSKTSFICSKKLLYSSFRFYLSLNPTLFNTTRIKPRSRNSLNEVPMKSLVFTNRKGCEIRLRGEE